MTQPIVTPKMIAAAERQARKAAHRVATGQVTEIKPTGKPGAELSRGEQRRAAKRVQKALR